MNKTKPPEKHSWSFFRHCKTSPLARFGRFNHVTFIINHVILSLSSNVIVMLGYSYLTFRTGACHPVHVCIFFLWQPHVICAFRSTRILFKLNLYFVSIWNQILHLVSFSSFSPPFISRLVFVSFYHGRAGIFSWHVILSLPLISCFYQFFLYLHMSTLPDMLRFIFFILL